MPLGNLIIWNSLVWALALIGCTVVLRAVGATDAFLGILFVLLAGFLASNTVVQKGSRH